MADSALETVSPPFMTFRFEVVLDLNEPLPGVPSPVCTAAFAECDGLELSMEPKSLREGGNNTQQIHLRGPVRMGQLTLRRGMTANHGLWLWMQAAVVPGKDRMASGQVTLRGTDGEPALTFKLIDCMPIKMRGPSLNAKDGQVAIEEMQLAYRGLELTPPGSGGLGLSAGIGVQAGASFSAGASFGASASASFQASGGLSVSGGPGLQASASGSASAGFGIG